MSDTSKDKKSPAASGSFPRNLWPSSAQMAARLGSVSFNVVADPTRASFNNSKDLLNISLQFARMQNVWGFGYWEWDLVTGEFRVLPSHLWRSMGYEPKEVLAIKSVEQAVALVHPEDRLAISAALSEQLATESAYEYSFRIRNSRGNYSWVQSRAASLRDANDKIIFIASVNYDITNEKLAEQELRDNQAHFERILHSSNDGIWEWSCSEQRLSFSQGCWRLLGFELDDAEVGKRRHQLWRARIHPLDRQAYDQTLQDRIANGGEFDIEYRIKDIEDNWLWIRTRGDVIYDEEGNVEYLAGAHIDITAIKRADERIITAKQVAEQANQTKSEFLSSMSHELRTPMNAILGFTQLFDYAGNITDEQRENINEIKKAGNQLLELINDVLELSKIEAGKLQFSLEPVAVGPLIEEVFNNCREGADALNISLSYEPHHLANATVRADKPSLRQAIINLICNAVHYNRPGGRIIVSLMDTAEHFLVISVRDTGRGVAAKDANTLFEPFGRKSAEGGENQGSGIGLAICKRLVELMGGVIEFDSEEGVGSCFQIHLPMQQQIVAENPAARKLLPMAAVSDFNPDLFAGKKLLYIEDNSANIRLLEQFFNHFNDLNFQVAEESVLGLYKARNLKPDLIILDINMPGMDGYEVLAILRSDEQTANIPVIALSANATNQDIKRALEVGFSDYLTKPVDVEQLAAVVGSLLQLPDQ
ncbi:PAS domain-containing protein [Halioxenophilus sp. WMMB6]|uniref:hybrid sensor histidine kinase/response regulator n=1 Tax=Halioxenophilus sp. WMMB6 TaxID=3073815 RepID=UPI00295ECAED|nr:PAS domain-containing protein [Halioxenophilus sp. WMMB6]